ncbi:MAG: beta galactosidase jelly roll domain-containing protein [Bacteroidales bacterium]|nr:beta galactosidase jelly roll domain-containing protein [Bacteroidales bacterium]
MTAFPRRFILSAGILLIASLILKAEVRLPHIFGGNMVLQRNQELRIWGWADKLEKVTVHFNEAVESTRTGLDGKWLITLPAMEAGGPYTMKVRGRNIIELENILIGDVWVCSGQSNMEYRVEAFPWAGEEAPRADYPEIRLFSVPKSTQLQPADEITGGEWQVCNPETVLPFSAVGYFFGRHIHKEVGVPIGLLNTNWGGTNIETWTSGESIGLVPEFTERVAGLADFSQEEEIERRKAEMKETIDKYAADEPGIKDGHAAWADPELDLEGWGRMEIPQLWEGADLPGLDGIVWFRLEIDLPAEVARRGITLELGPIDDSDWTWVNGHKVGETMQKYNLDRVYEVPAEYLKEGKNVIAVRVEDTGGGGGFNGSSEQMIIVSADFIIPLAGEWNFRVSPTELNLNTGAVLGPNSNPTLLYNGMIHPLLDFRVKGAIWYQGESNASRAYQYRELFPLMIEDWRKHWEYPDMPFMFVQLANFMKPPRKPGESSWAELREAQAMALSLPGTGMAVAIDIGEADDIHPINKQDVGKRLALAALNIAYGRDLVFSGPVYKDMIIAGDNAILSFEHVGGGLKAKNRYGYLNGFSIAVEDKVFHWARAFIKGDKVFVYSEKVKQPVAVRYGWADNPADVNLYNMEGLPASPFRTDDWPGVTQGRK